MLFYCFDIVCAFPYESIVYKPDMQLMTVSLTFSLFPIQYFPMFKICLIQFNFYFYFINTKKLMITDTNIFEDQEKILFFDNVLPKLT